MNKKKIFPLVIEKDEDGFFTVECPVLLGCYTQGKTLDEAVRNIKKVIAICLEEKENKELLKSYHPQDFIFHTLAI